MRRNFGITDGPDALTLGHSLMNEEMSSTACMFTIERGKGQKRYEYRVGVWVKGLKDAAEKMHTGKGCLEIRFFGVGHEGPIETQIIEGVYNWRTRKGVLRVAIPYDWPGWDRKTA